MKHFKRLNLYKASNVVFNPKEINAYSYSWWKFVKVIEGKVIFNEHPYSITTQAHQRKVRKVMNELGIRIDRTVNTRLSLDKFNLLSEVTAAHSLQQVEDANNAMLRRKERNERSRIKRVNDKLAKMSKPLAA